MLDTKAPLSLYRQDSGSPIIQDGHLVGVVTHVLVNDPARGYGIVTRKVAEVKKPLPLVSFI